MPSYISICLKQVRFKAVQFPAMLTTKSVPQGPIRPATDGTWPTTQGDETQKLTIQAKHTAESFPSSAENSGKHHKNIRKRVQKIIRITLLQRVVFLIFHG